MINLDRLDPRWRLRCFLCCLPAALFLYWEAAWVTYCLRHPGIDEPAAWFHPTRQMLLFQSDR